MTDAAIAESGRAAQALWRMRESDPGSAAQRTAVTARHLGRGLRACPSSSSARGAALEARFPGVRIVCFGHVGDGNLHYNSYVRGRQRADAAAREAHDVNRVVYDVVQRSAASSAPSTASGRRKREEIKRYKSAVELELMRALKRTLDPQGIMNPGKVLEADE